MPSPYNTRRVVKSYTYILQLADYVLIERQASSVCPPRQEQTRGQGSLEEIAVETGFGSRERMRRAFVRTCGEAPQTIRSEAGPVASIWRRITILVIVSNAERSCPVRQSVSVAHQFIVADSEAVPRPGNAKDRAKGHLCLASI